MPSTKNKKPSRPSRKHAQLKTLLAIALMLGAILAGLLMLSYQPGDKTSVTDSDKSSSASKPQIPKPECIQQTTAPGYPDRHMAGKSTEAQDISILQPGISSVPELDGAHVAIIMDDLGANLN